LIYKLLPVYFHNEDVKLEVNSSELSTWIKNAVNSLGYLVGDLNVIFCSDEHLKEINIKYLNHDYYTDIITFDYSEKTLINGDLFISIDRIKENSSINKVKFMLELYRVIIHGVLHLCGFNDKTSEEKKKIREKEDCFLSLIT
jgi:probable rRNA maturation factor